MPQTHQFVPTASLGSSSRALSSPHGLNLRSLTTKGSTERACPDAPTRAPEDTRAEPSTRLDARRPIRQSDLDPGLPAKCPEGRRAPCHTRAPSAWFAQP